MTDRPAWTAVVAEEVTQGLRDPDKALAYLRQAVANRSRSALRHHRADPELGPARGCAGRPAGSARQTA